MAYENLKERHMFKGFWYILIGIYISANAGVKIIPPEADHPSTFAIIIDSVTFSQIEESVFAYRSSIENDHLGAYIITGNWSSPDAVRHEIWRLKQRDSGLEGIALVGDIPIAMIRDAQHMTSAFKIDQRSARYPLIRTSVPSDRFYDDLDLEFIFIQQDTTNPLLFYYNLSPDSPQKIQSDLYSGRIKPPVDDDRKYQLIREYLRKVSDQKVKDNKLDRVFVFAGHGYHSESLDAWQASALSFRELFPDLFKPGGQLKNYYHEMSSELKEIIIQELKNPENDMAIFHAHGGDDTQYLLGIDPPSALGEHVEAIKKFVRSKQRSAKKRKKSIEELQAHYRETYSIPDSWLEGTFSDSLILLDSIWSAKQDLYAADLRQISPQPRVIYLDECFNGAYIRTPYTAGEYIFNDGKTIAVVANSVNVLQDVWADEHIGLIGLGIRIGQWNTFKNYLESHVIGDPTFRFKSEIQLEMSGIESGKNIKNHLSSGLAALRTLAVALLPEDDNELLAKKLFKIYQNDRSFNVRLQALKRLVTIRSGKLPEILLESAYDPYELIRRTTVSWMGDMGNPDFLPVLIDKMINDVSTRVRFNAKRAIEKIGTNLAKPALEKELDTWCDSEYKQQRQKTFYNSFTRSQEWLNEELLPKLGDKDLAQKKRLSAARSFRNYRFHVAVPELIKIIRDEENDTALRATLMEALGWYGLSYQVERIIQFSRELTNNESYPAELRNVARMTYNRLITGPNNIITR